MKNLFLVATLSFLVTLTGCGGPGETETRFDGGYVWTTGDKYVALEEVKAARTNISRTGRVSGAMYPKRYYYVLDSTPSADLSSSDVQGFFIKGDYDFRSLTLHKLKERKLSGRESFFWNNGNASKDDTFYYAADRVSGKKMTNEKGGYYKFNDLLEPGKYVGWIGYSFWIFEVK
ncbi:MAG: hypothetical protein ACQEV6_18360 [Pseudomonadota bacterium]